MIIERGDFGLFRILKKTRMGTVVRALNSGFSGPSSTLTGIIVLCSRTLTLIIFISTQEYRWVAATCQDNLT